MLARANGYRNFQHYRAEIAPLEQVNFHPAATESKPEPIPAPAPEPVPVDLARVKRLVRMFDQEGKLVRWPSKRSQQELCLWVIWSRIPARQTFTEKEINLLLNENHHFGDHALLRRWLCDYRMMDRTRDGREYHRIEKSPPAEALELIRQVGSNKAE